MYLKLVLVVFLQLFSNIESDNLTVKTILPLSTLRTTPKIVTTKPPLITLSTTRPPTTTPRPGKS